MGRLRDEMYVHGRPFKHLTPNEQFKILMPQLSLKNLERLKRMVREAEAGRTFDLIAVTQLMLDRQREKLRKALDAHPVPPDLAVFFDGPAEYGMTLDLGSDERDITSRVEIRKELLSRARKAKARHDALDSTSNRLTDRDLYSIFSASMPTLPDERRPEPRTRLRRKNP